jgi:TM2 domain-containing membrane protein YozV
MSTDPKSKGTALILAGLFGPLGIDKFYVGATTIGLIQLVLTLTIIGLVISIPWAFISVLTLLLLILFGTSTFLYPNVNWLPTSKNDQIIGWVIIGVYTIGLIMSSVKNYKK